GFALGLLLDLLAGGLSGGDCTRPDRPMLGKGNCVVMVVWDPAWFGGREHFLSAGSELVDYVRSAPRAAGVERITLPGEPEREVRRLRARTGLPIPEETWKQLCGLARELGVQPPLTEASGTGISSPSVGA
ncbi:MAG: Ldh family oxidoreductase, partial [Gemmataceae bacterium]|nr:Ldh family oxidoreductase [Gemmataceae bacterium]